MDTLHAHPYLVFLLDTDVTAHCTKFRRMHIGQHLAVDWEALDSIGETARARYYVPVDSLWIIFLSYHICRLTKSCWSSS
ncbi:hypothetical protein Hanom_Chr03g00240381 [Helianthus anomalus]